MEFQLDHPSINVYLEGIVDDNKLSALIEEEELISNKLKYVEWFLLIDTKLIETVFWICEKERLSNIVRYASVSLLAYYLHCRHLSKSKNNFRIRFNNHYLNQRRKIRRRKLVRYCGLLYSPWD